MLEPLPSNLSDFHVVQLAVAVYLVVTIALTSGLVLIGLPIEAIVYTFLLVATILGIPLFIVARRIYPEPPQVS